MADLSMVTGGLKLKNPIIIASGPLTARFDRIQRAAENGAAAVSLKHSLLKQKFFAKPRWYAEKGIGIIVSGDPRLEVGEAQELIRKVKEQTDLAVIANMSALPTDVDTWGSLAKSFEEAGADAVELNMNCPNLHTAQEKGATLGANLGQDPESCAAVIKNIKSTVKIPVIAKLPTEGGRLPQVSKSCDEAGVDILNIHAGFRAAPGLNLYEGGTMRYPGTGAGPLGGFSGPWSRLISNRFIADVARSCKAPIMGGGGISKWEHVFGLAPGRKADGPWTLYMQLQYLGDWMTVARNADPALNAKAFVARDKALAGLKPGLAQFVSESDGWEISLHRQTRSDHLSRTGTGTVELLPGQVIGLRVCDRKSGAMVEDVALVTDNGVKLLTGAC